MDPNTQPGVLVPASYDVAEEKVVGRYPSDRALGEGAGGASGPRGLLPVSSLASQRSMPDSARAQLPPPKRSRSEASAQGGLEGGGGLGDVAAAGRLGELGGGGGVGGSVLPVALPRRPSAGLTLDDIRAARVGRLAELGRLGDQHVLPPPAVPGISPQPLPQPPRSASEAVARAGSAGAVVNPALFNGSMDRASAMIMHGGERGDLRAVPRKPAGADLLRRLEAGLKGARAAARALAAASLAAANAVDGEMNEGVMSHELARGSVADIQADAAETVAVAYSDATLAVMGDGDVGVDGEDGDGGRRGMGSVGSRGVLSDLRQCAAWLAPTCGCCNEAVAEEASQASVGAVPACFYFALW